MLVWLITTSTSIINLERAMWKQMPCLGLIGERWQDTSSWFHSGYCYCHPHKARDDYIETIPCSPQIIRSLPYNNAQVVCKSITTSETKSNSDSSSCPDPSWNLKCMTMSDCMKVQAEDPVICNLIQRYKARELHRGKDTDNLEMKQFLKQRGKLLLRNGLFTIRMTLRKLNAQTGTLCN